MQDPATVARGYDAGAEGYDARFAAYPKTVARYRWLERAFLDLARESRAVVEIGCGTGRLTAQLPGPGVLGVDVSFGMCRVAAEKGLRVAQADAHALPLADASVDALIASNGVLGLLRAQDAFAEWARVLTPGGRLGVHHFAPHRVFSLRPSTRPRPISPRYPLAEVDEAARRAGLRPLRRALYRSIRFPPYVARIPAPMAWRWWYHAISLFERPGPGAPPAELPRWVCPVCHGELAAEEDGRRCLGCQRAYPLEQGVLRLTPPGLRVPGAET